MRVQSMKQEIILKAITSAIVYLEKSIKVVKKDEEKVVHFSWRAASDLEYALFLFSLMHQGEKKGFSWKRTREKKDEIEFLLISAQNLLKEAKNRFENEELLEAYKSAWMARGQLLKFHNLLEKQRRKSEKN